MSQQTSRKSQGVGNPSKKNFFCIKKNFPQKSKKTFSANQKKTFFASKKTFSTRLQASLGESGDFVPIKKKLSVLVVVVVVVVVVVGVVVVLLVVVIVVIAPRCLYCDPIIMYVGLNTKE